MMSAMELLFLITIYNIVKNIEIILGGCGDYDCKKEWEMCNYFFLQIVQEQVKTVTTYYLFIYCIEVLHLSS